MGSCSQVDCSDVLEAAARLRSVLPRTPLVYSPARSVWLKLESLQVTGAYKVRGALNAVLAGGERGDQRSVVAASAGNHGAGVAWAARYVGVQAVVAVPVDAPQVKVDRIEALGARVHRVGDSFEASLRWARSHARQTDARLIHAFDDPDVIAGQGTIALELLHLCPDVVMVPIGGGGLAAGISLVLRGEGIRLVGVQVKGVDAMASVFRGGPRQISPAVTVADGVRVRSPGRLTQALCRIGLDDILLVTERQVCEAMVSLREREGLLVEGAGAVASAAIPQVVGDRVIALVTGSNVSPDCVDRMGAEFGRDPLLNKKSEPSSQNKSLF